MTGDNQHRNSYLQFITAMLIFGTIGIFRKYIPLSSGMLAFTRGLLGCIFLLVFIIKMVDYLKKALIYGHTRRISS